METWTDLAGKLNSFLTGYGLLAIFVVMLLKELGVPVPVPSDLIVIGAGVQAAGGRFGVAEVALSILFAAAIGSTAQFLVARSAGRSFVYRFGRWLGLTPARLDQASRLLAVRGPLAVAIGLNLPLARAGIVPAAGLAGMGYRSFAPAMIGGSALFYGWHLALGYLLGPAANALFASANFSLGLAILGLALLGLVGWLLIRRRQAEGAAGVGETVGQLRSWSEAACPACLIAAAVQESRMPFHEPHRHEG